MKYWIALLSLLVAEVVARATVYVENASATQINIYQKTTSTTQTNDNWIKHRFYRYSTTPTAQWGWNGTKAGGIGAAVWYKGNAASWTRYFASGSTPWVDKSGVSNADPNPRTVYAEGWEDSAGTKGTPGSDYAEHSIDAGSEVIALWWYARSSQQGSADFYWRVSGANQALVASDIITVGKMAWVDNGTGRIGQKLDSANYTQMVFKVPSGATAIRFYPVGPVGDALHYVRYGDLYCYPTLSAVPGDTDWQFFYSAVLQSETTSDDFAVELKENSGGTAAFVTGPAHPTYETNMTCSVKIDGGSELFGAAVGTITSGATCVITTHSGVKAPDTGTWVYDLDRALTFSGSTMGVSHTWTKKAASIVTSFYAGMWSNGHDGVGDYIEFSGGYAPTWIDCAGLVAWIGDWQGLQTGIYFPATASTASLFGKRSNRISYTMPTLTRALSTANTGKLYWDGDIPSMNAIAVGASNTWTYTIAFDNVDSPSSLISNGRTVYIDRTFPDTNRLGTVEAGELSKALSGKVVKLSSAALVLSSAASNAVYTSSKDTSVGVGICRTSALTPESGPANTDWNGVTNSGALLSASTIKYATTGLTLTNNGTALNLTLLTNRTGIYASAGSSAYLSAFSGCTTNTNGAAITVSSYNLQWPFPLLALPGGGVVQCPQALP